LYIASVSDGNHIMNRIFSVFILLMSMSMPAIAQELLEYNPDRALAADLLETGYSLYQNGSFKEAYQFLRFSCELDPGVTAAQMLAGHTCWWLDSIETAAAHYRSAMALDPSSADAAYMLGLCLQRLGRDREALEPLKASISLDRTRTGFIALARAYEALGDDSAACFRWNQALECDTPSAGVFCDYADYLNSIGRVDTAVSMAERALALDPASSKAIDLMVRIECGRKQWRPAVQWLQRSLASGGDSAAAFSMLFLAYMNAGNPDSAQISRARLEALLPEPCKLHSEISFSYLRLDQFDNAIAEAEKALEADKNWVVAHYVILNASLALKDAETVCKHYRAILELSPATAGAIRSQLIDQVDLDVLCSETQEED
jgi:tetratricopeptide (TPR) repeat protein